MTVRQAELDFIQTVRDRIADPSKLVTSVQCDHSEPSRACLSCHADEIAPQGIYGRHTLAHYMGYKLAYEMQDWANSPATQHSQILSAVDQAIENMKAQL